MLHAPAVTRVTVVPDTVQTAPVVEVKTTGVSPELAVALTATVPTLSAVLAGALKVMVCAALLTVKLPVALANV
jgi:hypothetical protein